MLPAVPVWSERVNADIAAAMRRYNVQGATIAIIDGDRVVYTRGFGLSNVEHRTPASATTHYEINSITKQFTAAAIVQLSEAGKLDIDAKVATYVPSAPFANEVTVRELLTQTSGLPDYFDGPDIEAAARKPATFDQLMARIKGKPLDFAPGSASEYSNTNYVILGKIIEAVSHEGYDDYVRAHILVPLGMTSTYIIADEEHVPHMAMGYRRIDGHMEPAPGTVSESFAFSAGDLISTVGDLEKWDAALRGGRVVSPAGYAQMTHSQITTKGKDSGYGFGLFIDAIDGQPRIGHTGGYLSFTSADEYFTKQGVRIIALTNDGDDNGHTEAGEMLTNIAFEDLFPAIAAAALAPKPGEDPHVTARVKTFFEQMQAGSEDYSTLSPHLASKFKAQLQSRFASEFAPYGAPTAVVFEGARVTSGRHFYDYTIHFGPGVSLKFGVAFNSANQIASLSFG